MSAARFLARHGRQLLLQCAIVSLESMALSACTFAQPTPLSTVAPNSSFPVVQQADLFTVFGADGDQQAVQDVAEALRTHAPQVCRDLEGDCRFPVTAELFPDQASLDRDGMNPEMQGYYAYSGNGRIQMVSPRQPIPGAESTYADRVLIAVHEFVHLVNNEINPTLPVWMNEGVAIYIGPHGVYEYVCQRRFPFELIPAFQDMEQSYSSVPAADLFAYALVDFIVKEYGHEALNQLIRAPDSLEDILGVDRSEFEKQWQQYMKQHYTNQ